MNKKEKNKILFEDILYELLNPLKKIYYKIINKYLKIKYKNKTNIFEYKNKLYYKNDNISLYQNYSTLFSEIFFTPTYHYSVKNKIFHEHDFETVLRSLYFYPESFKILDENKEEYSKQELNFIDNIKQELIKMEYKDCEKDNEPIYEEYLKRNCQKNYKNAYYYNLYMNNKDELEKEKTKRKIILKIVFIVIILCLIIFLILQNN